MKSYLLRGVPQSLQSDGWWLSSPPPPGRRPQADRSESPEWPWRAAALAALVALADLLLWQVVPGLSRAAFGLAVLGLGWALAGCRGTPGLALAMLLFLPVVERLQALSLAFWLLGMALGAAWIAMARFPGLGGGLRFVFHVPGAVLSDALGFARRDIPDLRGGLRAGYLGWFLPVGLGLVFLSLLSSANPLLESWVERFLFLKDVPFDPGRLVFWLGIAVLAWPFLSLPALEHRLALGIDSPGQRALPRFFNEASIRRSLILFNAVFAAQTLADLAILWGGAALPDGMSYAQYAHRGAYPLLVTALLAGVFALAARPFTTQSIALRAALLGWLVQTIFLVVSSLIRLESYISVYGLTHLRLAALIWMALVAAGLALVIWQVLRHRCAGWLLQRCAALGAVTLYACSFLSFAATIAEYNLSHDVAPDSYYICGLDRAALPAIKARENATGHGYCPAHLRPTLSAPRDWREWGFRDWRTARSLSKLDHAERAPAWPTY